MKSKRAPIIMSPFAAAVVALLIPGLANAQPRGPLSLIPAEMVYPNSPDGYRPLVPPRADFGPGFVFSGQLQGGKLIFRKMVCPTLYPEIKPRSYPVVLSNYSLSSSNDAGLNLSTLDEILAWLGLGAASIEAKYHNKVAFTIALGSASDSYIALSDLWKKAKPIGTDPNCHAAIQDLKLKGEFTNSVFVVSKALTVVGLSFKFDNKTDASAGLTADIKKTVKASAEGSISIADNGVNTIVNVSTPIHLGIQVELIDKWVPSGAVDVAGQNEAIVNGHAVPGTYELIATQ